MNFEGLITDTLTTQTGTLRLNVTSVARSFLSEIANLTPKYRQIRHVFSQKSRKNRQFLASFYGKNEPLPPIFQFLLHFYTLIFF